MVQLKVTDGRTTRRLCLQPGEDSYQQLQQRLATFFPECVKEEQEMQLRYRDSDRDLITITTETEFQEALTQLPPESVWKLHIQSTHTKDRHAPSPNPSHPPCRYASAACRPRRVVRASQRNPWLPLFPHGHTHPLLWDFPSWSDQLDDVFGYTSLLNKKNKEAQKKDSSQRDVQAPSSQGNNTNPAEIKPKSNKKDAASVHESMAEVGENTVSSVPGLRVHKFGSWEPRHYEGDSGSGTVIGPVGYYATWSHGGDREEDETPAKMADTQEEGDKKREEETNEGEAVASGEEDTVGHSSDHEEDEPAHVDSE